MSRWRVVPLAVLLTMMVASPVAAHEGEGRIEVISAEPRGDGTIAYRLRVVFLADEHAAPESTVTGTVIDPAKPQAPQPLTKSAEDGIYEGDVRFPGPGPWTVRFTTLRPTATLERAEEFVAPSTTTSTASSTTTPPIDEPPLDVRPLEPSSSNSSAAVLISVVVAVVLLAVSLLWRRRSSP